MFTPLTLITTCCQITSIKSHSLFPFLLFPLFPSPLHPSEDLTEPHSILQLKLAGLKLIDYNFTHQHVQPRVGPGPAWLATAPQTLFTKTSNPLPQKHNKSRQEEQIASVTNSLPKSLPSPSIFLTPSINLSCVFPALDNGLLKHSNPLHGFCSSKFHVTLMQDSFLLGYWPTSFPW